MGRPMVEEPHKGERELAMKLVQQAERCAEAGLLEQAQAHLERAWSVAAHSAPDIADSAAWQVAWLRVNQADYRQAAAWFAAVAAPPSVSGRLWPLIKATVMRVCDTGDEARPAAADRAAHGLPIVPPAPTLPRLQITNFGRFRIVRGEQELPVCKARKALTIFRYLLTTPFHAAQKEELMELAWPEAHPREAAHSLHVAVSTLRRYLNGRGGSYVLQEAGRYLLDPAAPVEDDTVSFRRLVAAGEQARRSGDLAAAQLAYNAALDCYQGDYYVAEDDSPWAMAERERLLARYLSALDHLGRILIAQRQYEPAISCYRRLLERDSYREDAHGQLMRCYVRLGRRAAALQQYERCRAILAGDLGLAPMPMLQQLYAAVAEGELDPPA